MRRHDPPRADVPHSIPDRPSPDPLCDSLRALLLHHERRYRRTVVPVLPVASDGYFCCIGMGLHEALIYDSEGQLVTGSFMDYDVPRAHTVPRIETILLNNPSPHNVFGARGIGEPPIVAGAAAIANAIKDATGVRVTELPIRAEVVWKALHCQK